MELQNSIIHRVYEKLLSGLTWYSCYLRMQKANNCTNLPFERLYNKWFVSVPAELLWIPGIANYKQEVDWSIGPEHAILECFC